MAKIELRFPVMKIKKKVEERFSIGDLVVEKKHKEIKKELVRLFLYATGERGSLKWLNSINMTLDPYKKVA